MMQKAKLKLGILVNTDKHLEHISGLTKASIKKNYEVLIFVMNVGTRLLTNDLFIALAELPAVSISLCEFSARACGINSKNLPKGLNCGCQFENAMMNHQVNRVIVLQRGN